MSEATRAPTGDDPTSEVDRATAPEDATDESAPANEADRVRGEETVAGAAEVEAERDAKKKSFWAHAAEFPLLVLFAFLIAVLIKTFLVQAFYIPSGSMEPTLQIGDRVLVEKLSYRFGEPDRGDVVVFAQDVFGALPPDVPWHQDARNFIRELLGLPTGREQDYIKRVVGVEGDVIRYSGDPRRLIVNGVPVDEPYVHGGVDASSSTITGRDCARMKMERAEGGCGVPRGRVFVMGDNRCNSEDSRVLGPIRADKIVGHAFVILWPPSDFGGL